MSELFTNEIGLLYQVRVIAYNWCWVSLRFTQPTFYHFIIALKSTIDFFQEMLE